MSHSLWCLSEATQVLWGCCKLPSSPLFLAAPGLQANAQFCQGSGSGKTDMSPLGSHSKTWDCGRKDSNLLPPQTPVRVQPFHPLASC